MAIHNIKIRKKNGSDWDILYPLTLASNVTANSGKTVQYELDTMFSKTATINKNGAMSAADKTKLDGIAANANKYVHPTTPGNKHIPSGGSAGQVLKWSENGTAVWSSDTAAHNHDSTYLKLSGGTMTGRIVSENGLGYQSTDTKGYARDLIKLDFDNRLILGWSGMQNTPMVYKGLNAYELYHTGKKPTPADIGALSLSGGTLTGEIQMNNKAVRLTTENSSYARVGYEASSGDVYISNANNNWLRIKSDKTITIAGQKVYTALDKPTPEDIGAAESSHTHSYLPLSGGTMTGDLTLNKQRLLGANGTTILKDYGNGNVTLSAGINADGVAGSLYLGYNAGTLHKTNNVRLESPLLWKGTKTLVDTNGFIPWTSITGRPTPAEIGAAEVSHSHNLLATKGINTINSIASDTTAKWGAQGNSIHWYDTNGYLNNQPSQYGYLFNVGGGSEVHQLWMTQASGNILHRGGNSGGWHDSWRTLLDSSNYKHYAASANHNHDTLITRNLISTGFDKTKTGFQRPNGGGLTDGQLAIHITHPEYSGGQYSRGISFKYGGDLAISTYALSPDGNKIASARIYTEAYKPTPENIGAAKVDHDHNRIITSNNGGIYEGNGDAASSTHANVQIKSWFGVGFAPSISGQGVPQNQNAVWIDCRTGHLSARGPIWSGGNIKSESYVSSPILVGNKIQGRDSANKIYIGEGSCRIDTDENYFRVFTSAIKASDCGLRMSPYGGGSIIVNNVGKHTFNADGSKYGGSIEIEGISYGMSPIDSPKFLIEDILFDVDVEEDGTIVELNNIFAKSINGKYGVFANNGQAVISDKSFDSFKISGCTGKVDIRIVGTRIGYEENYYKILGGFEHGTEEEVSN